MKNIIILLFIILNITFTIDYNTEIQPIFNSSCISCHSYGSNSINNHQLILTSYSGLMTGGESGDVVIPYDSNSSILYQEISMGSMPPYGSGNDLLTADQINLIVQWINLGALEETSNWDCQSDLDCMDDEFCAVECFTGGCGIDSSVPSGAAGQYCQPCDECEYAYDAVSGNCDACNGTSDDCSDLEQSECESSEYCEWNDYNQNCTNENSAPECMMDCEGIETVDPEVDANAFCEWYLVAYDDTTCLDDCDNGYYDGIMDQLYSMCEFCIVDYSCDEVWNSENCSDLDQYDCDASEDCEWNDYSMFCENIEINCVDMNQCECEFDFDCQWNDNDMMCENSTEDGPPECWQDCEAVETLEDASGTEICNWFVPTFEDETCFADCHDCGPEEMIYDICQMCMPEDSCDDYFQDDEHCSDLDQDNCEYSEECQWNNNNMTCEDASGDDGGDDGPPYCMMDCEGIDDNDPDEDANSFCSWYIPIYDDGNCLEDCDSDIDPELAAIYSMCQVCLIYGNCDDMWIDLEICADLNQSECAVNENCEWNDYDMICEDTENLDNELIVNCEYKISSIYPNPFNPVTNINYSITENTNVSIRIYDISGNMIEELYNANQVYGTYNLSWDAKNQPSGLYFVKMTANNFTQTQKLMLVK